MGKPAPVRHPGPAGMPDWIATDPARMSDPWIVAKFSEQVSLDLYFASGWGDQGTCVVIEPGRTFKQVARLRIEAPLVWNGSQRQEATISNPVFEGDRMYYRAECHLYCIGPK